MKSYQHVILDNLQPGRVSSNKNLSAVSGSRFGAMRPM
jgi:hypothetical protein